MHARIAVRCLLAILSLACSASFAQEAFTRQTANVRAGPDRSYPLVAQLAPGAPLRVMGCLDDWTWCDVAFDDNRGWVYGPFLNYAVSGDRVPLYTYGPSLGIAIIGFSLGAYWDEHYHQRPWYSGRADWERRAPPPHRVPDGLPAHAVYTPGMHADRGETHAAARPPAREAVRGEQHAPEAPVREAARSNADHTEPQRAAPRQVQHTPVERQQPAQQREQAPQRPPQAQREPQRAPAQAREGEAQRGPERGVGEKGGEGKPERESH